MYSNVYRFKILQGISSAVIIHGGGATDTVSIGRKIFKPITTAFQDVFDNSENFNEDEYPADTIGGNDHTTLEMGQNKIYDSTKTTVSAEDCKGITQEHSALRRTT